MQLLVHLFYSWTLETQVISEFLSVIESTLELLIKIVFTQVYTTYACTNHLENKTYISLIFI
jgi:hypothetical protein